jgi:hypothetical protein
VAEAADIVVVAEAEAAVDVAAAAAGVDKINAIRKHK